VIFLAVFPLIVGGGLVSSRWLYGGFQVDPYPGRLSRRVLPLQCHTRASNPGGATAKLLFVVGSLGKEECVPVILVIRA
jgi:hypothetical protein